MKTISRFLNKKTFSFAILISFACGPGMYDWNEFKSYFMPESADAPKSYQKYNFSPQFLYTSEDDTTHDEGKAENLQAWHDYLKGKLSKRIIETGLYGEASVKSEFYRALPTEAKIYLDFLQKTQAATTEQMWLEEAKTTPDLNSLFILAKAYFQKSKDPFLKERYAYLALRLGAAGNKHLECVQFYDEKVRKLKSRTIVADWALARAAGSRLILGDSVRAFYEFAQIFERCPSRRDAADLSLRSRNIGFQEKALGLCQTEQEKANVYAFGAIRPMQEALPMLEKIAAIQPNYPLLEFLTAREINRNEFFYFGNTFFFDEETDKSTQQKSSSYLQDLGKFTDNQASKNPTKAFWKVATAYTAFLADDFEKAEKLLAEAKASPNLSLNLQKQISVQDLLLLGKQNTTLSADFENELIPILENLSATKAFRPTTAVVTACEQLAKKYAGLPLKKNQLGGWLQSCQKKKSENPSVPFSQAKSFLVAMLTAYQVSGPFDTYEGQTYHYSFESQNDQYAIEDTTSSKTLEQVLAYFQQTSPTDFDKRLMALTNFDKNYVYAVLGRRALVEHQYAKAVEAYKQIPAKFWQQEPYTNHLDEDPFYLPQQGATLQKPLNPLAFAQKMLTLQQNTDANAYYALGCGAYNMGYWGNAWLLSRRTWSLSDAEPNYYGEENSQKNFDDDYYANQTAKKYFEKALKFSKDPEQKAKILFCLAQIEQHEYLLVYNKNYPSNKYFEVQDKAVEAYKQQMQTERGQYNKYFSILKNQYRQTKYQNMILEECSTYKHFVGK